MKRYEWPAFVWVYADDEASALAEVEEAVRGASMGDVSFALEDGGPVVEDEDD